MYDLKSAVELMEGRGYIHTASNHAKNVLFFLKKYEDKNMLIHATIRLDRQVVELDSTGVLSLGISLECTNIPLENVKFEDFEQTFYNYLYICVYANKPVHQVDSDRSGDESVDPKQNSKTLPGLGGVEKAEGKAKKPIEERKKEFWDVIKQVGKEKGLEKEMCKSFWDYWTEMNPGGKKMRFEMEKIFDVSRRLKTWLDNDKKWLPIWKQKEQQKAEQQEKETKATKQLLKHKDLF